MVLVIWCHFYNEEPLYPSKFNSMPVGNRAESFPRKEIFPAKMNHTHQGPSADFSSRSWIGLFFFSRWIPSGSLHSPPASPDPSLIYLLPQHCTWHFTYASISLPIPPQAPWLLKRPQKSHHLTPCEHTQQVLNKCLLHFISRNYSYISPTVEEGSPNLHTTHTQSKTLTHFQKGNNTNF